MIAPYHSSTINMQHLVCLMQCDRGEKKRRHCSKSKTTLLFVVDFMQFIFKSVFLRLLHTHFATVFRLLFATMPHINCIPEKWMPHMTEVTYCTWHSLWKHVMVEKSFMIAFMVQLYGFSTQQIEDADPDTSPRSRTVSIQSLLIPEPLYMLRLFHN